MRGGGGGGGGRGKRRGFCAVRSATQLYRLSDHRPVIRAAGGGGGGRVWWPSHPPSSSPQGARAGGEGGAVSWAQRGGGMKRQQPPRRRPFLFRLVARRRPPPSSLLPPLSASTPKIFPPGPSCHTDTDDRPHRQLLAGAFTGNAPSSRMRPSLARGRGKTGAHARSGWIRSSPTSGSHLDAPSCAGVGVLFLRVPKKVYITKLHI